MPHPSVPLSAAHPAVVLGGLGLVAGLGSAVLGIEEPLAVLQPVANLFAMHASLLPIGLCFAGAMGVGAWILVRSAPAAVAVVLASLYGWSGAVHIAIRLQRTIGDDAHLLAASLAAGAFGAGLVHLGFALGAPSLRRWQALVVTCAVGALAALLFYAGQKGLVSERALFAVWQPAVALVIGWQMAVEAKPRLR